jgi:hypothetical protein
VFLFETSVIPQAGSQLSSTPIVTLNNSSSWQYRELTLPEIYSVKRLVFTWKNDNSDGTQPPAAIDKLTINSIIGVSDKYEEVIQYYSPSEYETYYIPKTLKKLTVTSPASQIKYGALYNCNMLEELVISSTINGLAEKALYGCSGLTDIYAHRAMPPSAYANSTFDGVNKFSCKLHVPAGSKQYYSHAAAAGWNEFFTIEEEAPLVITALPLPYYGGEITGVTAYNYEDVAAITAHNNMGYDFQGWMEGQSIVSASPTYSFTVTSPRTLYAVFTPRENENSVIITPSPTEVSIAWDSETGASSYTLTIYTDAARTQVYTTLHFNADGTPQQVPLLRSVQSRMSHTVDGLQAGQDYYYSITSYDENNYALTIAVGDFTTLLVNGIEDISSEKQIVIYSNSEIIIKDCGHERRNVQILDISGRVIWDAQVCQNANGDISISISALPHGVYLLKTGNTTGKFVKK